MTRDGNLQFDGNRRLTTAGGGLVSPTITIPPGIAQCQLSIGQDGTVLAAGRSVGKISHRQRALAPGLLSAGENAFVTTAGPAPPTAAPATTVLTQGASKARTPTWPRRWPTC